MNYCIKQLSVEVRASMEPVPNGQTIEWYKVNLNFGKISEAKIRTEAVKFFTSLMKSRTRIRRSLKSILETL